MRESSGFYPAWIPAFAGMTLVFGLSNCHSSQTKMDYLDGKKLEQAALANHESICVSLFVTPPDGRLA